MRITARAADRPSGQLSAVNQTLEELTGKPGDAAVELEFEQAHVERSGRLAGAGHERIERDRLEAERGEQRDPPCPEVGGGRRAPRRGAAGSLSSSRMSSARSTSLAPWRSSAWQPRDCGEWIEPGMANTSRPASTARRAVISEPDCTAASTTSVPRVEAGDDAVP